jgi:SAM-dependent methyltransferase
LGNGEKGRLLNRGIMNNDLTTYFQKRDYYFEDERIDIASFIEEGENLVLEIGCGKGNTGRVLRETNKAFKLVGIELNGEIAARAEKVFDNVLCGDVEALDLPCAYGPYDYVVCGDVLEHLRDPWTTLKKIYGVLKPGGFIIASIPTIRNWRVIIDLIFKGEFSYRECGVLDITHLRFFTKRSIRKLFEDNRFKVMNIHSNSFGAKASLINKLTFGLFDELLTLRYLVKAMKPLEGQQ